MPQDKIRISGNRSHLTAPQSRYSRWIVDPKNNSNDVVQMPGNRFTGIVIEGAGIPQSNAAGTVHTVPLNPLFYAATLEVVSAGRIRARAGCELASSGLTEWFRIGIFPKAISALGSDTLVEVYLSGATLRAQSPDTVEFDLESIYEVNFRIANPEPKGRS